SKPIIKINPSHKRSLFTETPEWHRIYDQRPAVERAFSRLKGQRRLNNITVRGNAKVTVHCFMSMMAMQAQYLSQIPQEE
ncbi:MAG: transposase, partial [Planctomycetota bacterium]|nr:transposase [Planctomycetota bacterium]